MTSAPKVPQIVLNDGNRIPQFGFGVFQIPPDDTAAAVRTALELGYRHIDTAEMYRNEKGVGQGVRDAGIDRDEVFVTSKLNNGFHKPDDARRAFDATIDALGFDYVDLFLIHWPLPTLYDGDFVSTWKTLEEFKKDGRARSIGVSNFGIHHLEELARDSDWCCPTASIGKVFLLIEAARAIRAGQVSPDELLRRAEFDLVVTPDYGNTSRLRPSLCPMSRGWSAV